MNKKIFKELIYEIIMLILSVLVGIILYLDLKNIMPEKATLLKKIDYSILIVFIFDYFYRLKNSIDKKEFIKKNIIDLIAIIPFDIIFRAARLLRLSRILRILRILKAIPSIHENTKIISGILKTNNLLKTLKFALTIILLSGLGIYFCEEKMTSFSNAIWWAVVTASTVGYGDFFPVTLAGRLIALALMLTGIGTIGMLTGSIATFFLNHKEDKKDEIKELIISRIENIKEIEEHEYNELLELIKLRRNR